MRSMFRLKISTKLYCFVGMMFLLVTVVAGGLIWTLRDTEARYSTMLKRDVTAVVEELRMRGDLQNFGRQMNDVLLMSNPAQGIEAADKSLKALMADIKHSKDLAEATGASSAIISELRENLTKIVSTSLAAVAIKRVGAPGSDAQIRAFWNSSDGRPLVTKLYDDIAKEADLQVQTMRDISDQQSNRTNAMTMLALAVIAFGMCTAGALTFVVTTLGITRPLRSLGATMRRLANHDLAVEVFGASRKDEVGEMASAVQVFKDNAIRAHKLEQDKDKATARNRAIEEEARAKAEAEHATTALVVAEIGAGLENLAAGNLTYRLEAALPPAYEKLRSDLNAALEQLQELVRGILTTSSGLHSGTGEITQAADDLSRRTEQQAATLEQTAAGLDEITGTIRKTAEGAKSAHQVVFKTKTDAESSGNVVRDAIDAMSEIERSSQQIGQIISVIDEIAFQTNLLALNAGVEAARAGDAGRGFAVVASEVRALAQRSAEAAKEIKMLISASARHVGSGVKLVGETGSALERIVAQVSQINGVVSEIARSAQEQATGLQEINSAVAQMDQVTQQNAAMVEQTTAAAHSLANQTSELVQLTNRFKVEIDGDRVKVLPFSAASKQPPARASSQPIPERKSPKPDRVRRVATQAKPAQMALAASGGDQWQEF